MNMNTLNMISPNMPIKNDQPMNMYPESNNEIPYENSMLTQPNGNSSKYFNPNNYNPAQPQMNLPQN